MSNKLIKIIRHDDGILKEDQVWCLLAFGGDTERTLCSGEAIDGSTNVQYIRKTVKKNGITCNDCMDTLRHYKSIKL